MIWENAVLSEDQCNVEMDASERKYLADRLAAPTRKCTSSTSPISIESRSRQPKGTEGVNGDFEGIIGVSLVLRAFWISFGRSHLRIPPF
jgi:hypothetical protein